MAVLYDSVTMLLVFVTIQLQATRLTEGAVPLVGVSRRSTDVPFLISKDPFVKQ